MVKTNPLASMTTPLPVRCEPKMPAVKASSGTSARSFTTDRLIPSKSSPDIAAPQFRPPRASRQRMSKLGQVPLLKRHHPALVFRVSAGLIVLRQDSGLIVLRNLLVLFCGLVPTPDHPLDVDLRGIAVDQPKEVHIR